MKIFQKLKHKLFIFHKKLLLKKTFLSWPLLGVLYCISILWKIWAYFRWQYYKLKKPYKVSIPVVGVGNIVAGGVGKTPLVIKLINDLKVPSQIGLLSRGYGSLKNTKLLQINEDTNWQLIGDEPKCILNSFPKISLFIGANRKLSAKKAIKENKKLLILDDAFQQKNLFCNFNVIVLDCNDLFGENYFLPRGYLKDSPNRLCIADLIVINHCYSKKEYDHAKSKVQRFSSSKTIGTNYVLDKVINSKNENISLRKQKVGIFCSIANPNNFIKTVKDLNCEIVAAKFFNDHEVIEKKALLKFENKCYLKGAKYLICTEKDYVKVNSIQTNLTIVVLKIKVNICFERHNWDNLIEKIQADMNNLPVILKEKINEKLV